MVSFRKEALIPIVFDNSEIQVFAVRFINPDYSITGRVMGYNGFRFHIGDWEVHQSASYTYLSRNTAINMFYIGLLIAFSLFHILLFVFNRSEFRNLYFSIFVGMLALLSYLLYRAELSFNTIDSLIFFRFLIIAEVLVLAFAAKFTHSIDKNRTPFYANLLHLLLFLDSGWVQDFSDLKESGGIFEGFSSMSFSDFQHDVGIGLGSGSLRFELAWPLKTFDSTPTLWLRFNPTF